MVLRINTVYIIYLGQKCVWMLCEHHLFLEVHSFPQAKLRGNYSLLGRDNVCGQLSMYILTPSGGCYLKIHFISFKGEWKAKSRILYESLKLLK